MITLVQACSLNRNILVQSSTIEPAREIQTGSATVPVAQKVAGCLIYKRKLYDYLRW